MALEPIGLDHDLLKEVQGIFKQAFVPMGGPPQQPSPGPAGPPPGQPPQGPPPGPVGPPPAPGMPPAGGGGIPPEIMEFVNSPQGQAMLQKAQIGFDPNAGFIDLMTGAPLPMEDIIPQLQQVMTGGMPPEGMPPEGMPPEQGMPPEGMPPEQGMEGEPSMSISLADISDMMEQSVKTAVASAIQTELPKLFAEFMKQVTESLNDRGSANAELSTILSKVEANTDEILQVLTDVGQNYG